MRTPRLPLRPPVTLSRQSQPFSLLRSSNCPGQFLICTPSSDYPSFFPMTPSSELAITTEVTMPGRSSRKKISAFLPPLYFEPPSLEVIAFVVSFVPLCLVSANPTSYSSLVFTSLRHALHQERSTPSSCILSA